MHLVCAIVVFLAAVGRSTNGFIIPLRSSITVVPPPSSYLYAVSTEDDDTTSSSSQYTLHYASSNVMSRNRFFISAVAATSTVITPLTILSSSPQPSYALVKGNTPPPKKKASTSTSTSSSSDNQGVSDGLQQLQPIPKCRNVEECQEMAERLADIEAKQYAERAANNPKPKTVGVGGRTKYLDVVDSTTTTTATTIDNDNKQVVVAKLGDIATIHYKVLKIGKRSYDGLSGEGTVVFSRGYGLEDDEQLVGDHNFTFTIGQPSIIQALNDAIPGMSVNSNSVRRIGITPQNGWEKNTNECDGGPGGRGAGGNIKVDYAIVPTATMVDQEACFDRMKLPFPTSYAQERRMAQRFDQSLIMEVRLVDLSSSSSSS